MMRAKALTYVSAAVLLAAALAGCGHDASEQAEVAVPAIEVDLATVDKGSIQATVDLIGTLIPVRATTIVSDVDGIIEAFPTSDRIVEYEEDGKTMSVALGLDIGHRVHKGDVLVKIDPVDFQLALEMAKAQFELARRDLENLLAWKRDEEIQQLEAQLERTAAQRDKARSDLERSEKLLGRKAISESEHEAAVTAFRQAQAAYEEAEAMLKMARQGPTKEQVAVAEAKVAAAEAEVAMREEDLSKTTIRAPYDAVVSDRYVDVGDRVTALPRVEIMQLVDPQVLFAQVAVPERFQQWVKLDAVATVRADGVPEPVPGRVDLINSKIDPETRTFRIRITVDNRQGLFTAGGFVHVELPLRSAEQVITVPREALSFADGRPSVFVYDDGRVRRRDVELGIRSGAQHEVLTGLTVGERIAVDRIALLADGLPVEPRKAAPMAGQDPSGPTADPVDVQPASGARGTKGRVSRAARPVDSAGAAAGPS
jgi:multidrug efflux pump subunit AcrA (membrane-fusion protein)